MEANQTPSPLILGEKLYGQLKWLVAIVLPACGTLYFALAQTWGLPAGQEVLGSILAVQAFLGVILGISTVQYNASDAKYAGDINIVHNADTNEKSVSVAFNDHPSNLDGKKTAVFKVKSPK